MIYSTKKIIRTHGTLYYVLFFYYVTVVLFCFFFACLTKADKSLAMQTGAITK